MVYRPSAVLVSIHAPPNRKERPCTGPMHSAADWFQSTPLPTGRSDYGVRRDLIVDGQFQSTPLPTGRSDQSRQPGACGKSRFNPRPSQPEGATGRCARWHATSDVFQSTPLPTGRSDLNAFSAKCGRVCFNPRPSQPEGATSPIFPCLGSDLVSIHAPPNRKERQRTSGQLASLQAFQSTPLPTGRSDPARRCSW